MLFTDLAEIKGLLQIDPNDHTEDFTLNLYVQWTTSIFEEILDRDFTYKTRTVIYPGTGNQKLLLRHRPVYPTAAPAKASSQAFTALTVKVDNTANFSSPDAFAADTALTLGTDYAIRIDLDDGGSREAILYRINDYWNRPFVRQQGTLSSFIGPDLGTIQVTSTAGHTVDTLPGAFRAAADWLVARFAYMFPLGMQQTSESYIDRSIGLSENQRRYLLGAVRPLLWNFRNWHF